MKVRDTDYLTGLLLEVIPRYSCLIFCATKKNCESVAQLVCSLMPKWVMSSICSLYTILYSIHMFLIVIFWPANFHGRCGDADLITISRFTNISPNISVILLEISKLRSGSVYFTFKTDKKWIHFSGGSMRGCGIYISWPCKLKWVRSISPESTIGW